MNTNEIVQNYLNTLNIHTEIKTLEDITKLIKAHLQTFAFSSLKVLLKEEISLDLMAIYENLVVKKRGGYCFEHNKLMFEVLKTLGFDVTFYLARVVNNTENIPPQTHRFSVLNFEGERYLIDVGIGFRSPSVPVKFSSSTNLSHLGVNYQIKHLEKELFAMVLMEKEKPFIATKFDLKRCYEADFDMGHFYSHKHPKAAFVNNLVVTRITQETIYSLVNAKYLQISKDKTQEVEIQSTQHLHEVLHKDFNSSYTQTELEPIFKHFVEARS